MDKNKNALDLDKILDRTRAMISRRLTKAFREGRLEEELKILDREEQMSWRKAMNGPQGRGRRRRAEARS